MVSMFVLLTQARVFLVLNRIVEGECVKFISVMVAGGLSSVFVNFMGAKAV